MLTSEKSFDFLPYTSGRAEVPPEIHAHVGIVGDDPAILAPEKSGGGHRGAGDAQGLSREHAGEGRHCVQFDRKNTVTRMVSRIPSEARGSSRFEAP